MFIKDLDLVIPLGCLNIKSTSDINHDEEDEEEDGRPSGIRVHIKNYFKYNMNLLDKLKQKLYDKFQNDRHYKFDGILYTTDRFQVNLKAGMVSLKLNFYLHQKGEEEGFIQFDYYTIEKLLPSKNLIYD